MDIVPLGPGFAAELRGVTLADMANDDAAYRAVRAALEAHSVLVFRNQEVTDESQIAFSRRFGPLEITQAATQGAGTHLVILSTIGPDGKVVPGDSRVALRNKANQLWHADSTFKSVPALASVLSARIIPSHGGETEYVSTSSPSIASTRRCRSVCKLVRLARLFVFARQGRTQHCCCGRACGAAAAMLADGVDQSGQRPARSLYRFACLRHRRFGTERGAKADRRAYRCGDRARLELYAHVAAGRCGHVGQPRDAASRPAMAAERGAADRAHHHFGKRCRRPAKRAAVSAAGGGVVQRVEL